MSCLQRSGAALPRAQHHSAARRAPTLGGGALAMPMHGGPRALARRLNARVAAVGRSSLHVLRTAWSLNPPLPPPSPRKGARGGGGGASGGVFECRATSGAAAGAAAPAAAAAAAAAAVAADQDLTLDLDWKASLTLPQEVICWHTAAAVCCVAYALTAPPALSIPYGTCIGLLFGLVLVFMRSSMMEVLYKVRRAAAPRQACQHAQPPAAAAWARRAAAPCGRARPRRGAPHRRR
jgi:hypothetical protein